MLRIDYYIFLFRIGQADDNKEKKQLFVSVYIRVICIIYITIVGSTSSY